MKIETLDNWYIKTLEDIVYYRFWERHIIHKGFYCNGGSLPRLAWFISHPLLEPFLKRFIIHDWEYSNLCKYQVTRKQSDEFLLYNLSLHNKWVWLICYSWVRVFWKSHFKINLPFEK